MNSALSGDEGSFVGEDRGGRPDGARGSLAGLAVAPRLLTGLAVARRLLGGRTLFRGGLARADGCKGLYTTAGGLLLGVTLFTAAYNGLTRGTPDADISNY